MKHDLYIFGSVARGEVSASSDIDLLAIPFEEPRDYPRSWSVYSPQTIEAYYSEGRLFAWHLHLESKCVHSHESKPYLIELGTPSPYQSALKDINELEHLLLTSLNEIDQGTDSLVYELGIVYTAIRDIAMSASWALLGRPSFSKYAPYHLSIPFFLPLRTYDAMIQARHASTRGASHPKETDALKKSLSQTELNKWIEKIKGAL